MGSAKISTKVYTLPDCPNCTTLKRWLKEHEIPFEEKAFDTEAQLDFIMRNMFGSPPILEVSSRTLQSEELFSKEQIDEEKIKEALEPEEA